MTGPVTHPLHGISQHVRRTVRPSGGCDTCHHRDSEVQRCQSDLQRLARRAAAAKNGPPAKLLAQIDTARARVADARKVLADHKAEAHTT